MEKKLCPGCNTWRPIEKFPCNGKDRHGRVRRRGKCSACEAKRIAAFRKKNPDYGKEYRTTWKQRHDKIKENWKKDKTKDELLRRYSFEATCLYCGKEFRVISLPDLPGKIVLVCKYCASQRQKEK